MYASSSTLPEYEVEQKFPIPSLSAIETRLQDLGFEPSKEIRMVDWYWDNDNDASEDHPWLLTLQDNWLRFRQVADKPGNWQLKLRQTVTKGGEASTVYEEVGGLQAVSMALERLEQEQDFLSKKTAQQPPQQQQSKSGKNNLLLDEFLKEHPQELPKEMVNKDGSPRLTPFAKIETRRSSWVPATTTSNKKQQDYAPNNLKVDLDVTNFGYAVGEVEIVVHGQDEIAPAQQHVNKFAAQLTASSSSATTTTGSEQESKPKASIGKLEYYLIQNRPDHYQALVDRGII